MRFVSARVFGLFVLIFLIILAIAVSYFNQDKLISLIQLTFHNNFQTQTSLPLSSFFKIGVTPYAKVNNTVFWQDGMFLYKSSVNKNAAVFPYALTGQVELISDRYFKISRYPKPKLSLPFNQTVIVRLSEQNGDVAILQRKNGKTNYNTISYTLIKPGDIVRVHSLKPVSKDSYVTTQIFVLAPEVLE